MIIEWTEEAIEEFAESAGYYEEQQEGLGERLIVEVEAALAKAVSSPNLYRRFERDCRKVRVESFPYAVVYIVRDDVLKIVAVMNQHRKPGYWHERLDR